MKYVCIDDSAVSELISGREYQSIDFEEGDRLIKALSGRVEFLAKIGRILLYQDNEGAFLTTEGPWKQKKFVVIDCEQSSLFTQLRSHETLSSFQKLLRFCTKFWSGGVYNKSEKIITGTSKAVIFPLPYSTSSPFRIAIEREPLKERLRKRDMEGHFLLVYKSGREGADSASEEANETNFRRVFDRIPEIYRTASEVTSEAAKQRDGSQMASTNLTESVPDAAPVQMPFDSWLKLLTSQQRKFITADPKTPHRLQGPAGTGKTLSLMLRTIRALRQAKRTNSEYHALLITHSEATKQSIQIALSVIDPDNFQGRDKKTDKVALSVETLASLCAQFLHQAISESEFVDRDAQDSKILQKMYIEQAIEEARLHDFPSFRPHLSEGFRSQFNNLPNEELAELFQHEISVMIKGRAGDSFDIYKKCPPLKYGLPVENDADKGFIFDIFGRYQKQLEKSSQFDTDDVVISAAGQLDTPIWRRRRQREGYDFIAIDETHLFNINELHIFHHFTRSVGNFPISFTVDQAQAVGDRGWNDISSFANLFECENNEEERTSVTAIFRNSPEITELCHSVLASGATLFTNFENTLLTSRSVFTPDDERRSQPVEFVEYADDISMIEGAFRRAEELQSLTRSTKSQVLITSLSSELLSVISEYCKKANKPVTVLDRRGDFTRLKQAEKSGHLVLGHADFVGGLEFNVVIIVGVDKGRVPYDGEVEDANSRNYATYVAHNRLYVAASRARYALSISGVKSRGPSDLLRAALDKGIAKLVVHGN